MSRPRPAVGLTGNVAREVGWNIRCNAILPGIIDNPRSPIVAEVAPRRG
jgi:NAD(P)-dependent dehydrogenase (short-subunit alcohol dehydrogenase family)